MNKRSKAFAQLLATEGLDVEHHNTKTAYFDLKNRKIILPNWHGISEELEELLNGHESAHAFFTPADMYPIMNEFKNKKGVKVPFGYINVIEDCRIDILQLKKYPGLRKSYARGGKEIWDRNFFGVNGENTKTLSLVDRINLYFKVDQYQALPITGAAFTPAEQAIVDRIKNIKTFEEVLEISYELYMMSRQDDATTANTSVVMSEPSDAESGQDETPTFGDDEDSADGESADGEDSADGESADGESADGEDSADGESADGESADGESADGEDSVDGEDSANGESANGESADGESADGEDSVDGEDSANGESADSEKGSNKTSAPADNEKETPSDDMSDYTDESGSIHQYDDSDEFSTQNNLKDRLEDIVQFDDIRYSYFDDKAFDGAVSDYKYFISKLKTFKENNPHKFINSSTDDKHVYDNTAKEINTLVSEFRRKRSAKIYRNAKRNLTGDIDMNRLTDYKLADDIFLRKKVLPEGKNHGMMILIDTSSSMSNIMGDVIRQVYILTKFFDKANIPFEVYAFSSRTVSLSDEYKQHVEFDWRSRESTIMIPHDGVINIISSKMNKNERKLVDAWLDIVYNERHGWYSSIEPLQWIGSTPLQSVTLALVKPMEKFIKDNKLDKRSFIMLTDGGANRSIPTGDVIVDKKTKLTYSGRGDSFHNAVKLFKDRTKANVINLFMTQSFVSGYRQFGGWSVPSNKKQMKQEFENKGATSIGDVLDIGTLDDVIIINIKSKNAAEEDIVLDTEKVTRAKARNAFTKSLNSKGVSRVLVKKIIENIA